MGRTPPHPAPHATVLAIALFSIVLFATSSHAQQSCSPLPPPSGPTIEVAPSEVNQLRAKVANAASGTTILLQDGTYDLSSGDGTSRLSFGTANVTLRSLSGNRDAVVLDGNYGTNELISIYASKVTIADLTLMRAYNHPIHISGLAGNPISGILIHNVRIVDPREQAIKVNPIVDGYVDNSTIECCSIELTDVGADEGGFAEIFADSFESGSSSA